MKAVANHAYCIGKCGSAGIVQNPGSSEPIEIGDGSKVAIAKVPAQVRTENGLSGDRFVYGTFNAARPGQEAMIRFPCSGRYTPLSRLANFGISLYFGVVNEARVPAGAI